METRTRTYPSAARIHKSAAVSRPGPTPRGKTSIQTRSARNAATPPFITEFDAPDEPNAPYATGVSIEGLAGILYIIALALLTTMFAIQVLQSAHEFFVASPPPPPPPPPHIPRGLWSLLRMAPH
jgi:hypothetical protein